MPGVNLTINSEIKPIENETLSVISEEIAPDTEIQPTISAIRHEDKAGDEQAELRARLQAMIGGYLPEFYEFQRTGCNILYPKPVDIEALQARVNAVQIPGFLPLQQKRFGQAAAAFLDRFRLFRKEKEWHNNALDFIKFRLALKDAGWDSPQARDDCEALKYANRMSAHLSGTLHLISLLSDGPEQQIAWKCARQTSYDELLRGLLPIDTEDHHNQYSAQTRGNLTKNHPDNIKFNAIVNSVTLDERMAREVLSAELEGLSERLLSDIALTRCYAGKTEGKNETQRIARDILTLCQILQDIIESIKCEGKHIRPLPDRSPVGHKLFRQRENLTLTETIKQELVTSWKTVRVHAREYSSTLGIVTGKIEKNAQRILHKHLKSSNPLDTHTAKGNINEAISRVGIILLDKIQQTAGGIHKIRQTCHPLQQAVTHYNGLRRMLSDMPPNTILDAELRAEADRWRNKIEELKNSLQRMTREITTLAEENIKQKFLSALRDELNHAPGVMASDSVISDFDTQIKEVVEALASIDKEMNQALLPLLERGEAENKELHEYTVNGLQRLKFIKNNLKTSLIKATGRSINNFSRQGMLARRLGEWSEEEKQRYLSRFSEEDRTATEKAYDSLFLEVVQHYLPLLSGESDPEGNRLLQRLRLEMGNAAKGTTLYPATMDEIIAGMKSRNQVIRGWAGRKLVRMVFLAACLEGINLIPNLAALPLRMGIKFAITGAKVAWAARKGQQGIRGGEGDISDGVREYAKQSYKTAALKVVLSLPPGLATVLGVSAVCLDVYEGGLVGAGKKIAKNITGEVPWRTLDIGSRTAVVAYTTALVDAAVNEVEPVNHSAALPPQTGSEPHPDVRDHNAVQIKARNKRALATQAQTGEYSDFQDSLNFSNFSEDKKKTTYLYGIKYALFKIENDENFSREIRDKAYLSRIGASLLVPVDICKYKLNNTFLLPDYPGSKSGVIIRLDSEKLYYYVGEGKDVLPDIKWAMPFDAKVWRSHTVPSNIGSSHTPFVNGFYFIDGLIDGSISFDKCFNYNNSKAININSLATILEKTMAEDYKKKSTIIKNEKLINRAILGAQIPDQGVSVTEVKYRLEFDWGNLKPEEYLRSFSHPFAILGGQMQLIFSNAGGETLQQTKQNIISAEYIGAWIDLTLDVATAFTPTGFVIGLAQSVADIGADVLENKSLNTLNIISVILSALPEGRIAAKVGRFSHVAGQSVKYGLLIGKKVVDLAVVGTSIKAAKESGDPFAIYQALTACGLSVRSTYHLAKNIASSLKISRNMEESATLKELEALQSNLPEYTLTSDMPFLSIMTGKRDILARIKKGQIEICRYGEFIIEKGNELHLAAYRLENARKVRKSIKDKMPIIQSYATSIDNPPEHEGDAQEMLYSGFSGSRELTFDQTIHHQISLNKITKFVLTRKFKNSKTRIFDHVSLKFKKNNEFTVASNTSLGKKVTENISSDSINISIDDMGKKTVDLLKHINKYNGKDKDEVINNLIIIQRGLVDARRIIDFPDTDYNSVYVLTKTGMPNESVTNHYGLATFRYDIKSSDLHLDFLMAHPYVVINKYPEVANFLINNGFISTEQLHKYNIKNVARFLGSKAICNELESYDAIPGESVKTFSFNGANPITQSIGYQLESISKLFSRKSTHDVLEEPDYSDELDIPGVAITGTHDYQQSLEILKSYVRDSFASVKSPETISPEATEAAIQKMMRDYDAEILSENITDGLESPDEEVKEFSGEVITSVNHAYEKISKVKSFFDESESSPEIKDELKALLDEAAGLNDDVLVDIDKKDISSISEMVYDRFKNNIDKIHLFLSEQKTSNYNFFVLYKYRQPGLSNAQAIALPYDLKKRIMVAMLPKDKRRGGLVDTVVHEVLHNAANTQDHTYIGDLRAKKGSFPSSFEFSARKTEHFIANNKSKIDNIRYALDLPQNVMPGERQQRIAHAILHNSKLIKADTLLNAAEYNAYMIHVLSRARIEGSHIKLEESAFRNKRSVDESDSMLDNTIMLALLGVSLPKHHIDFNPVTFSQALEVFINQDVKTPVSPHFLPYVSAFESMPKSQEMTLQQVNELESELSRKSANLLAKAKYQYAVLAYLSMPEEIKMPINVIRNKIIQSKEKILDEYEKEKQINKEIRKQLRSALLDNHRMKNDNSSTVASEIQKAMENKINDLLIKNKANADLIFQHSRKLGLLSKKLSLWDSAFI